MLYISAILTESSVSFDNYHVDFLFLMEDLFDVHKVFYLLLFL